MATPEFTLLGDAVWLDFVNSARGREPDPSRSPARRRRLQPLGRWPRSSIRTPTCAFPLVLRLPRPADRSWPRRCTPGVQPPAGGHHRDQHPSRRHAAAATSSPGSNGSWRIRFAPARPLARARGHRPIRRRDPGRSGGHRPMLRRRDLHPLLHRRLAQPAAAGGAIRRSAASNGRVERRRGMQR